MAEMISTAAVSITIGYTALSIFVSHVYGITFIAACMAYSERRENAGRRALAVLKAVPKSEAGLFLIDLFL